MARTSDKLAVTLHYPKGRPIAIKYFCKSAGKFVRKSTGTYDEHVAEAMRREYEAKIQLEIDPKAKKVPGRKLGDAMPWQEFRERYTDAKVNGLRAKTRRTIESELDLAERIVRPNTLGEMADPETLAILMVKLAAGAESRYDPPRKRSPHTVKSYMGSVLAALNWAHSEMQWLSVAPSVKPPKVSKEKGMKGRPINAEEHQAMLDATAAVVGGNVAESWKYLLRGLWESGLRLEELMTVSWDDPTQIMPVWIDGKHPVLQIPADKQKNDTEESIPLLPGFERLLEETPDYERYSWVFNPGSLQVKTGRKASAGRMSAEWVDKVISRIGKAAEIVVEPAKRGNPAKYASAHDYRRGLGTRLADKGVQIDHVAAILRHADTKTTKQYYVRSEVQRTSEAIREKLAD